MFNNSVKPESNLTCKPTINQLSALLSIIPLMQVLINLVFVLAVYLRRAKLRNNFVYAYVISLLMANVMFGIFSALSMINRGLALEVMYTPQLTHVIDHSNALHQHMTRWWALRSSFVICLYLTMSSSVSALIYGIRESTYFVGPGVMRRRLESDSSENAKHKHYKAALFISSCWIGPFVLSLACVAGWNCVDKCQCFSGYYDKGFFLCQTNKYRRCSGLHQPLSQQFILTAVVLWFVLAVVILGMFVATLRKYHRIAKRTVPTNLSVVTQQNALSEDISMHSEAPSNNGLDYSNAFADTAEIRTSKVSHFRSFGRYNVTIKLMFFISILFVTCSTPSVVVLLIDIVYTGTISTDYVMASYAVALFYCVISPFVMSYYMSDLRDAMTNLVTRCCSRTIVQQGSIHSTI